MQHHERGQPKEHRVGVFREEVFFLDQLHAVGQALQPAEPPADARRTESVLMRPETLRSSQIKANADSPKTLNSRMA